MGLAALTVATVGALYIRQMQPSAEEALRQALGLQADQGLEVIQDGNGTQISIGRRAGDMNDDEFENYTDEQIAQLTPDERSAIIRRLPPHERRRWANISLQGHRQAYLDRQAARAAQALPVLRSWDNGGEQLVVSGSRKLEGVQIGMSPAVAVQAVEAAGFKIDVVRSQPDGLIVGFDGSRGPERLVVSLRHAYGRSFVDSASLTFGEAHNNLFKDERKARLEARFGPLSRSNGWEPLGDTYAELKTDGWSTVGYTDIRLEEYVDNLHSRIEERTGAWASQVPVVEFSRYSDGRVAVVGIAPGIPITRALLLAGSAGYASQTFIGKNPVCTETDSEWQSKHLKYRPGAGCMAFADGDKGSIQLFLNDTQGEPTVSALIFRPAEGPAGPERHDLSLKKLIGAPDATIEGQGYAVWLQAGGQFVAAGVVATIPPEQFDNRRGADAFRLVIGRGPPEQVPQLMRIAARQ